MSRTPLFSLVRRSLRLADLANRSGLPADELVEQLDEHRATVPDARGISRRTFVQGATASALALAACTPFRRRSLPANREDMRVLVVGAGIAGLSAAYRLQQAGV